MGLHELERTEELLSATLGGSGYWVRPPWGFASAETLRETTVPLIHWSLDTEDWSVRDADKIAQDVIDHAQSGDIVLLHDAYASSVDAALKAVDVLQSRGYEFVTVAELFEQMGVQPELGRFYTRPDKLRPVK